MRMQGERQPLVTVLLLSGLTVLMLACQPAPSAAPQEQVSQEILQVVATTTILGDVVKQIGGEHVQVSVLVPPGADPHSFQPAPSDIRLVSEADLVITSGAGLDPFLDQLLEAAITQVDQEKMIPVSEGIGFRQLPPGSHSGDQPEEDTHPDEAEIDPHVWFDPRNVLVWTENISQALSQIDPANADQYSANATQYRNQLEALDDWIQDEVEQIPAENRVLVSDHQTLGYFADRYGFQVAGTLIPGTSAAAAPSAENLAALVDAIQAQGIKAIFVGSTVSPALARQVAADTGVKVVPIFTDSLTPPGGEASTYLDMMRYNVRAIVEALQ